MNFTRRQFLHGSGVGLLALSLGRLAFALPESPGNGSAALPPTDYRGWEDLYRRKWTWDSITKGTHCVDCYPGGCSWNVYSKDGVVWREEQVARYPVVERGVPDMNPRGCQKGSTFSQVMYGAERVKYPLKRAGARGSGKWARVSWDEALGEIADAMITAATEIGPESIVFEVGPGNIGIFQALSMARFAGLLGATTLDVDGLIGDFNVGNYITFGKFQHCSSNDDWFHADLILIWHMNPLYTRIPEAHYITEARYKGAEVVSIAPDFNPSCIHADLYVPVEPGSDAALGLAMAHVIVNENLYNASFVKEQTDLALLVRTDTKEFLREADLESGGRDDQFYVLDTATKQPAKAPPPTLALGKVDPTLEGQIRVRTLDAKEVEAVPAFVLLKKHLEAYAPERAAQMCGVQADVIRDLARKVAKKRTHILVGWNSNKYYHGDLMERAQCLPYPTLTRRAQFYIDHDWFLEAGEGFPTHKPNPRMGGNHPFRMTSGHQRWSIHSIWVVNKMLSQTHQGRPTLFMNPDDAKKKGIGEGDLVRVFNDFDSFHVHVKLAPAARPGQLIIYHAWEPYQFQSWKPYDTAIPGMVKWLHLAGGYGHLRHWRWNWQPQQADRAVAIDVVRA